MGNGSGETKRPLHLASFCLVVMPFFLLSALAAFFLPGSIREAESSIASSSGDQEAGQIPVPPSPFLLSTAPLSPPPAPAPLASEPQAPARAPGRGKNSMTPADENEQSGHPADPLPAAKPSASGAYDFGKPVPAMDTALIEEDFWDVIFIGDSRTEGFQLYSGPQNATYYHSKGLKVDTIFSSKIVKIAGGGMITIMEALQDKPLAKVYIMLGINELGWAYSDLYIQKYAEIIAAIREIEPEVQIYVQSLLPVSQKRSQNDKIFNNANINEYNELIRQMAAEERLYYLNVAECVADEEGNLCSDASTDGIHLNKAYCDLWFGYLKSHYVNESDMDKTGEEREKIPLTTEDKNWKLN